MSSLLTQKNYNPIRRVHFHNNAIYPHSSSNHKQVREWHDKTSIAVPSLSQLHSQLYSLIEDHHFPTEGETKQKWTIQTISIVWNMPPEDEKFEVKDVRTPLDEDNWKEVLQKVAERNTGDWIRVQYVREREKGVKKWCEVKRCCEIGDDYEVMRRRM